MISDKSLVFDYHISFYSTKFKNEAKHNNILLLLFLQFICCNLDSKPEFGSCSILHLFKSVSPWFLFFVTQKACNVLTTVNL